MKTSSIMSTYGSKDNNSYDGRRKICSVELPYAHKIY